MTKQTALVFLLAAAVTLSSLATPGRWRPGCSLGGLGALGAIIGLVTFAFEPMFASSLMGEGQTPWDLANWMSQMEGVSSARPPTCSSSPRWPCLIWLADRPRRTAPVVLWISLLGTGLVTVAKLGSGLNYFLSLRIIEASGGRQALELRAASQNALPLRRAACVLVTASSLVPSLMPIAVAARLARNEALFAQSPEGLRLLQAKQQFFRLAENPKVHLLTDSGMLQLYQRGRAAFVDPFQFRLLVDSGVIRPGVILDQTPGPSVRSGHHIERPVFASV